MSGNKQTIDELPKNSAHFARYLRAIIYVKRKSEVPSINEAPILCPVGAGAVWMTGGGACAALLDSPNQPPSCTGGDVCVALVGTPDNACAALVGIPYPRFWVGNKVMFPLLPTSQKCYNTTVPFNGKDTSSKHSS